MSFASSVETLELNSQGSKEVLGISPGTYIRLVQQLKGKPLFPQLKRLCIEDYHGLVDFFPLFLASNLRSIRLLSTKPPTIPVTTASLVLRNLICDLSEWSQEIQHLHIAQSTILQTWMFNSNFHPQQSPYPRAFPCSSEKLRRISSPGTSCSRKSYS